jgi:hypothetical protein
VRKPVAVALYMLQGEEQAYLGCLLPTLAVTIMMLTSFLNRDHLTYCKPLVMAMLEGIRKWFSPCFEDKECQLAAAFHPRFKLMWLQKHDSSQVRRVKVAMEEAVEASLREAAAASPGSSDSSSEDVTQVVGDFYGAITQIPKESSSRRNMHKSNAIKIVSNWLSSPSRVDLGDGAFLGDTVLVELFVMYNTPVPSSAAVERFFSQGKDILRAKRASLSDQNFDMLMFLRGNRHLWKEK